MNARMVGRKEERKDLQREPVSSCCLKCCNQLGRSINRTPTIFCVAGMEREKKNRRMKVNDTFYPQRCVLFESVYKKKNKLLRGDLVKSYLILLENKNKQQSI